MLRFRKFTERREMTPPQFKAWVAQHGDGLNWYPSFVVPGDSIDVTRPDASSNLWIDIVEDPNVPSGGVVTREEVSV